ncbi:hypothetical protein [Jannaschia sp. W003]|nr:hypothetical protein [Jannaschia sp. W003]UWQ20660.1 hypothetical protein K3554_11800 [Jannaschia sp. W003]
MSTIAKFTVLLGAAAALSGCLLPNPTPEEIVIVEPAPVVVEPSSGKF